MESCGNCQVMVVPLLRQQPQDSNVDINRGKKGCTRAHAEPGSLTGHGLRGIGV